MFAFMQAGIAFGAAPDKAELKAMRERIEQLKRDVAGKEESRAEAADQLRDSEHAISEANRSLRELGNRQSRARNELRDIAIQTRRVESDIAGRQSDLERALHTAYVNGATEKAKVIFSGGDPQRIARDLYYYGYISRAHAGAIQTLRANVRELAELGQRAKEKALELAELEREQRDERGKLEGQRRERKSVMERLAGQIKTGRREISSLQRNEQRLSRLVEQLSRMILERPRAAPRTGRPRPEARPNDKVPEAVETGGVFSGLAGRLRLPVRGELMSRFGAPRSEGGVTWKGLFIRAIDGAEVQAIAEGRVVFADWMRGFGNLLILDHGKGYLTIYGNNESLLKQPGEIVRSGEGIATVGRSGGNDDSGLYFEVRHQGKAVDPMPWITAK